MKLFLGIDHKTEDSTSSITATESSEISVGGEKGSKSADGRMFAFAVVSTPRPSQPIINDQVELQAIDVINVINVFYIIYTCHVI